MRKRDMKHSFPKYYLAFIYIILVAIIGFCGIRIINKVEEYLVSAKSYSDMAEKYVTVQDYDTKNVAEEVDIIQEPIDKATDYIEEPFPIHVDFDELIKQNPEIVAWLYCPDTVINYPVAHADDNDKYLHSLIDGSYNFGGTIFLDCACSGDFSSKSNIIYGHNMNDGSMFRSINQYINMDYYKEHPNLYLATPNMNYKAKVFSCFITPSMSDAYNISFSSDGAFQEWLNTMEKRSAITTDIDINSSRNVLMLSTCNYSYTDARLVVLCMLEPIGKRN